MVRSFSTADYLPKNYLLYIQLLFAMILISFLPCLNKMPDWMLPDFSSRHARLIHHTRFWENLRHAISKNSIHGN